MFHLVFDNNIEAWIHYTVTRVIELEAKEAISLWGFRSALRGSVSSLIFYSLSYFRS